MLAALPPHSLQKKKRKHSNICAVFAHCMVDFDMHAPGTVRGGGRKEREERGEKGGRGEEGRQGEGRGLHLFV